MNRGTYQREVRERAVRMVFEHQDEHSSEWAEITPIAERFGMAPRRPRPRLTGI
jgi:transposase